MPHSAPVDCGLGEAAPLSYGFPPVHPHGRCSVRGAQEAMQNESRLRGMWNHTGNCVASSIKSVGKLSYTLRVMSRSATWSYGAAFRWATFGAI